MKRLRLALWAAAAGLMLLTGCRSPDPCNNGGLLGGLGLCRRPHLRCEGCLTSMLCDNGMPFGPTSYGMPLGDTPLMDSGYSGYPYSAMPVNSMHYSAGPIGHGPMLDDIGTGPILPSITGPGYPIANGTSPIYGTMPGQGMAPATGMAPFMPSAPGMPAGPSTVLPPPTPSGPTGPPPLALPPNGSATPTPAPPSPTMSRAR